MDAGEAAIATSTDDDEDDKVAQRVRRGPRRRAPGESGWADVIGHGVIARGRKTRR